MIGYSGTYALNGVNLQLPPTEGEWDERDILGYDGNGRPIYPAVRSFTMKWDLISSADLQQLINAQRITANTGTVVVDLPQWGASDYIFTSYTGAFVQEPSVGAYFVGYTSNVTLIITNIRTDP